MPHLAQGLRSALLLHDVQRCDAEGAGLLLLAPDLTLRAASSAGERWLSELADVPSRHELPQVIYAAVARLCAIESGREPPGELPRARVRAKSGRWLIVHASRLLAAAAPGDAAVIIEPAQPAEIAPILLEAHGLSRREAEVAWLVLQGLATTEISKLLCITDWTVQQHLKSVFNKVGVSGRRELVARIFLDHYQPRMHADGMPHGH